MLSLKNPNLRLIDINQKLYSYTFKFPQKKLQHVHYVSPYFRTYQTVPIYGNAETNQVLLFWKNDKDIDRIEGFNVEKILCEDAMYTGQIINMPIVILLEKNNDSCDLYYIRNNSK